MSHRILQAAAVVCVVVGTPAWAQLTVHRDGGGYTYRSPSGNSTYAYRYDTGATYKRVGNHATYRDNTGTVGQSIYSSGGRYDSYGNLRQGWSGSGYTPYAAPSLSTYSRRSLGSASGTYSNSGGYGRGSFGSGYTGYSAPSSSMHRRSSAWGVVVIAGGLLWAASRAQRRSGPP